MKHLDWAGISLQVLQGGWGGWPAGNGKKIKQQPSMLPGPAVPGSCLASFHFLWALPPHPPCTGDTNYQCYDDHHKVCSDYVLVVHNLNFVTLSISACWASVGQSPSWNVAGNWVFSILVPYCFYLWKHLRGFLDSKTASEGRGARTQYERERERGRERERERERESECIAKREK